MEDSDMVFYCTDCGELTELKIVREMVDVCYGHGIIETVEEQFNVSVCCDSHDVLVMPYKVYLAGEEE